MTLVTVPTLIYGADDKADKAEDQLRHPTFPEEEGPRCSRRAYIKCSLNVNSSSSPFFAARDAGMSKRA